MMFAKTAGQSEILCAEQMDESQIYNLQEQWVEIVFDFIGNRAWIKFQEINNTIVKLLYYIVTTLATSQTIGEEYTRMVQIDGTMKNIPSWSVRFMMVLLKCGGQFSLLGLLKYVEHKLKSPESVNTLIPDARIKLLSSIQLFKTLLPFLVRLHEGVFYMNGTYYNISKRLTNIKYVLAGKTSRNDEFAATYKLLGTTTILYATLVCLHESLNWWRTSCVQSDGTTVDSLKTTSKHFSIGLQCSLCLDDLCNSSTTPCGHIFCWNCIMKWLQTNEVCPLCRNVVQQPDIVFLQNFISRN